MKIGTDRFLAHEALKEGKHVLVDSQLAQTIGEVAPLESFARSQERAPDPEYSG